MQLLPFAQLKYLAQDFFLETDKRFQNVGKKKKKTSPEVVYISQRICLSFFS